MSSAADGKEMSFWDHLDELRGTIIRSVAAVCIFAILAFLFKDAIFAFVLAPCKPEFFLYELLHWSFRLDLINIELSAQFFVHLKIALALGLVLSVPYVIWEVWRFISPALYPSEAKPARWVFILASLFFYFGAAFGYCFVLPVCLNFFMNYSVSPEVVNTISISSYISMFMSMVLLIGLVFQFPLAVILLSRIGLVDRSMLRKGRKYALVAILVIAALITPSDPFSMFVLACPMYLLYELSILFSKNEQYIEN